MFRNTLAQSLQLIVTTLFSLLLAPIMLSQLGLTLFGVWTVVGAIVLYASLIDVGVSRALARFVALYDARGERRLVQECIGLGLVAVAIIAVLLVPAVWFGAPLLSAAIDHQITVDETRLVLLGSAAIFLAQGVAGALVALPHGLQQMMGVNVATMIGNAVNFAFSVAVLLTSRSLPIYAWANAAAELLSIAFVFVVVRRVWPHRIARWPSRALVREVLGYSVRAQAGWLADLVNMSADRIVIGLLVDVRAAGVYALAASVAMGIRSFGVLTVSAMIPTATAEIARDAGDAVRRLFRRYGPLTQGLSLPVFVFGALSAPFVLQAWLGERTEDAVLVLVILTLAYAANVATGVPSTLLMSDGRPGFVSTNAMITAAVNITLSVMLAPLFGLWGVVGATAFSIVTLSIVLIVRFVRDYGLSAADVRRAFLPPAVLSVLPALPLVAVVVATESLADSRASALALLAGVGLAYGVPYWLIASRANLIPHRLTPAAVLRRPTSV